MTQHPTRLIAAIALVAASACGGHSNNPPADASTAAPTATTAAPGSTAAAAPVTDTTAPAHHSKMAGAAIGAIAGHELGGHAVLGAAAGAMIQHERNKHAAAHP